MYEAACLSSLFGNLQQQTSVVAVCALLSTLAKGSSHGQFIFVRQERLILPKLSSYPKSVETDIKFSQDFEKSGRSHDRQFGSFPATVELSERAANDQQQKPDKAGESTGPENSDRHGLRLWDGPVKFA